MYNYTKILRALIMLAGLFFGSLNAQVTGSADVSRIVSYQGQITTTDGISMNGTHHITATLYSDHLGKNSVWQGSYDVAIANGIFTLMLGTGASKLPDNNTMNRPLWVGISVDGSDEMSPLTELSAAPYALNVPDKSITQAKLAEDVQAAIFGKHIPTIQNAGDAWSQDGNTTSANRWLGTKDAYDVEIHVYDNDAANNTGSGRVMGFYHNASSANILGGYKGNTITSSVGATIGGGGVNGAVQSIASSNYATIGGGEANSATNSNLAFIGGGYSNLISSVADAAIVGGYTNVVDGAYSSIGGGYENTVDGIYSAIPGGRNLTVGDYSFGFNGSHAGLVDVSANSNIAYFGDVDLWLDNLDGTARKLEFYAPNSTNFTSFKAGAQTSDINYTLPVTLGATNTLLTTSSTGTLSWQAATALAWGLTGNSGTTPGTNFLGTTDNKALDFDVDALTVLHLDPSADPTQPANIVAGATNNIIAAVGGGYTIWGSTIAGGGSNYTSPEFNRIEASDCFIGSGEINKILGEASTYSMIGAGVSNTMTKAKYSFIGSGYANSITGPTGSQVSYAVIGGGSNNAITSGNAYNANIPGGDNLTAQSYAQTVIGFFNTAQGTSSPGSTNGNDRVFIIGNGTDDTHRANAFEVSNNGHSIVYGPNGSGGASGSATTALRGATYSDNVIDAWGHMKWQSTGVGTGIKTVLSDFGVTSITRNFAGNYTIALNLTDPAIGTTYTPQDLAVTITMCDDGIEETGVVCTAPLVTLPAVKNNTFKVDIFQTNCARVDHSFMFHVTGR